MKKCDENFLIENSKFVNKRLILWLKIRNKTVTKLKKLKLQQSSTTLVLTRLINFNCKTKKYIFWDRRKNPTQSMTILKKKINETQIRLTRLKTNIFDKI